jgi:hypothetical protein
LLALLARRAGCFCASSNHNSAGTSIIWDGTDAIAINTIGINTIGINAICVYDGSVTIY